MEVGGESNIQNTKQQQTAEMANLSLPRIARSSTTLLDRSLFSKNIPIAAARVLAPQNISKYRQALTKSQDMLLHDRIAPIRLDPDPDIAKNNGKCLLLQSSIKADGEIVVFWFSSERLIFPEQTRIHGAKFCKKVWR